MEQKHPDPEIAGILEEAIGAMATRFQTAIERGQIAGEIAVSVEPLQTARGLLGLYLGLYMLVRSGTAKEPVLGAVLEEAKGLLAASATPEGAVRGVTLTAQGMATEGRCAGTYPAPTVSGARRPA